MIAHAPPKHHGTAFQSAPGVVLGLRNGVILSAAKNPSFFSGNSAELAPVRLLRLGLRAESAIIKP
jgi:hypothetical protein